MMLQGNIGKPRRSTVGPSYCKEAHPLGGADQLMRIPVKLLVLIAVVTGLGLFSLGADNTSAALNSFTTSAPSFVSGSSVTLTLLGTDDANGANPSLITMTASGATTPILTAITCNVGSPAATCVGGQPSPTSAASLVYDSTQFDSVNNTADSFTITVSLTATCISNATITVSVNQVISRRLQQPARLSLHRQRLRWRWRGADSDQRFT